MLESSGISNGSPHLRGLNMWLGGSRGGGPPMGCIGRMKGANTPGWGITGIIGMMGAPLPSPSPPPECFCNKDKTKVNKIVYKRAEFVFTFLIL